MYVLINKSKLNNDVNNTVNFQKMQILCFTRNLRLVVTQTQNLRFYGTLQKGAFKKKAFQRFLTS